MLLGIVSPGSRVTQDEVRSAGSRPGTPPSGPEERVKSEKGGERVLGCGSEGGCVVKREQGGGTVELDGTDVH